MLNSNKRVSSNSDDSISVGRRSFMKKTASAGLVAGATSVLGVPYVHAKSKVTIRILNNETAAASQRVLKTVSQAYEKEFGVKVVVDSVPISGSYPKILAAARAGEPYHLSTQGYISSVLEYADAGLLEPVTELVNQYTWGRLSDWEYKGEKWFYPYDFNLVTMYYRKDLYEKHNLKVPTTWDEMLHNCQTLTEVKDGDMVMAGCVVPLQSDSATNWASFGSLLAEVPKFYDEKWNVIFDQGETGESVAAFLDLYAEMFKTMPPGMNTVSYAELMSLFVTGKTAHTLYSGRLVESLEANNPELADKYGIFALPDRRGKRQALSFAFDGFLLFKHSQSEEGLKFMKWFIDNYYIEWLHSAWMNFQPARMDIYDNPKWNQHPMIQKHWDVMMQLKSFVEQDSDKLIAGIDTSGPEFGVPPCRIFNENVLPEMLQNKVLKGLPSSECVKIAADKIRTLS